VKRASFLLLALSAAALALPVSIAAGNAALALLTLALLARLRSADGRARAWAAWRAEPALCAVTAYVAAGLLAGALGDGPARSLHDSVKDAHRLWSLGLFVAAFALEPEARPWAALAAGCSLAAAIGVAQALLFRTHLGGLERAHAFVHPVTFGEQMALAALGGLCWLARERSDDRARGLALAATALAAAALALSQTRAALLAFGVGAAAAAWLEPRARRWAGAGLALGALGALFGEWLRYGRAGFAAEVGPSAAATAQGTRYVLWSTAWRMFRDHPWTGVGPGHFATEFPRYFSGTLDGDAIWASAHNLYLHQLAERGLVGEAALLSLLWVLLARAWRAARASRGAAALWAAAAVPAFLVMNVTETAWQTEQFAALFLLVWAFGTARSGAEIL
jgi:O-antigen ligase